MQQLSDTGHPSWHRSTSASVYHGLFGVNYELPHQIDKKALDRIFVWRILAVHQRRKKRWWNMSRNAPKARATRDF
jgi:hypothetical protein